MRCYDLVGQQLPSGPVTRGFSIFFCEPPKVGVQHIFPELEQMVRYSKDVSNESKGTCMSAWI